MAGRWDSLVGRWGLLLIAATMLGVLLFNVAGCSGRLQPEPKFLMEFEPTGSFHLDSPEGISLGAGGRMLIADTWHDRIISASLDMNTGGLTPQGFWGKSGSKPGELSAPSDVALGPGGEIYVTDTWNHRVQKFSSDGRLLAQWGKKADIWNLKKDELLFPRGIAVAPDGNVYVADTATHRVIKYTPQGKVIFVLGDGQAMQQVGKFDTPLDVAVDGQGNLYVSDSGNNRIERFDANGNVTGYWGTAGDRPGQFKRPSGLAIDEDGHVYVVDSGNHRVQIFQPSGKLISMFGDRGAGPAEFESPESIAIGPGNTLYIVDWGNNRLQAFSSDL